MWSRGQGQAPPLKSRCGDTQRSPGRREADDPDPTGALFLPCNILALDTSTPHAAVAVATAAGAIHSGGHRTRTTAAGLARPVVDPDGPRPAPAGGLTVGTIDLFAVGLGPGSYTGLRIGLTAAKVLAYAAQRPLVGFDSLEAIARNAPERARLGSRSSPTRSGATSTRPTSAAPRRGPLVRTRPPASSRSPTGRPGSPSPGPNPCSSSALASTASAPRCQGTPRPPPRRRTGPTVTAWPGPRAWHGGRRDDPWFLEPAYLRRSAAEEQWQGGGKP